ncbi:MAG: phosphoribosyltransferase [Oscillospiraceae bacterium]|nr:phosphoribosyltransferase [Oscillospiraceae bacterium]
MERTYRIEDYLEGRPPELCEQRHRCRVYWFGYQFRDAIASADRTAFLHWLKGIGEPKISDAALRDMIEAPLGELHRRISLYDIDCILYPGSGRSELVRKMIRTVNSFTAHETARLSFELVKQLPAEVGFDREMLRSECEDEDQFRQIDAYVRETLLPSVRAQSYFSIAECVKPKYRRYMEHYLVLTQEQRETLTKLDGKRILIIDDIATSGATLDELLRIVGSVATGSEIYLFTLIGREG